MGGSHGVVRERRKRAASGRFDAGIAERAGRQARLGRTLVCMCTREEADAVGRRVGCAAQFTGQCGEKEGLCAVQRKRGKGRHV